MGKPDPVELVKQLGGKFSRNVDDYASRRIAAHQIICVLCDKAPCVCGPCPKCGWHGAPDKCQAC